jgi:protein-disulfide isomerase
VASQEKGESGELKTEPISSPVMQILTDVDRPASDFQTITAIGAIAASLSAWLLAGYILPHTIWGISSPIRTVTDMVLALMRVSPMTGSILLALITGCVLHLYRSRTLPLASHPSRLWYLTGLYAGVFLLPGILHRNVEAVASVGILLPLVVGLLAARLCTTSSSAVRLFSLLAVLQAIYTLWFLKSDITLNMVPGSLRPSGTFHNSDSLIIIMVVALPIAIAETIRCTTNTGRTIWSLCATLQLAALASTGSRTGLLAVLCAISFILLRAAPRHRILFASMLAAVGIAVSVVHWKFPVPPTLSLHSLEVRSVSWTNGLQHIKSKFWNGEGIGSFDKIQTLQIPNATCTMDVPPLHEPGNTPLHWMEELGVAGGILYCIFVGMIAGAVRRQEWNSTTVIGAAWVSLMVISLFDTPLGNFSRGSGTAMFGLLLGATMLPSLAVTYERATGTESKGQLHRQRLIAQYVIPTMMFGIASCFMWFSLRAIHNQRPVTAQIIAASTREILAGRSGFLGDPNSPFTLVEFADYECPPCRANRAKVHDLLAHYPGKLKLDFRNLPLPTLHPNAMYAAIVAEASKKQGRFWDTNAMLFDLTLSEPAIQKVIKNRLQDGILPVELMGSARSTVEADLVLANQLGIDGTPSFLLCCPNGKVYRLASPESAYEVL